MSFSDIVSKFGSFIMTSASKILTLIIEAPPINIIKCGLFIGTVVVSAVITIKSTLSRYQAFKNKKNMSSVDGALLLNYADRDNRNHLHKRMRGISSSYKGKDYKEMIKLYGKKKAKQIMKRELRENIENLHQSKFSPGLDTDYCNYEVLNSLETFKREFQELKNEERERNLKGSDGRVLNKIWNSNL